jgi:thiamine kinase-like enzyme
VFEWIHGTISDPRVSTNIVRAADFIRALKEVRASFGNSEEFEFATESCLRPSQVVEQIRARLDALKTVENPALRKFVDQSLAEKLRVSEAHASKILDGSYHRELDFENWILSPSDFGLHNSIMTPHGDLVFIDFEYFGWDDPVKLTADFCLHPAMGLTEHAQRIWLAQMSEIFAHDKYFAVRLGALYPLYAIRWALITLNEFRHDKIKNRRNAQDNIASDLASLQASQLEKAEQILVKAEKMTNDGF